MNKLKNSESWNRFLLSFAGPKATSFISAFLILLFLSLGTLFTDFSGSEKDFVQWQTVTLQSFILSLVYYQVLALIIKKLFAEVSKTRFWLLNFLFFSTEAIRAIFIGISAQTKFGFSIDWDYRVVAGGLTGLLFFGIAATVLNDSFVYRQRLLELRKAEKELLKTTTVTIEDIQTSRNNVLNSLRQEINKALSGLVQQSTNSKDSAATVVSELVRVSEEVVRPLSHNLLSETFADQLPDLGTQKRATYFYRILNLASLNPFHPRVTSFLAGIQLVGVAIFEAKNQLNGFISLIIYSTWIFLVLYVSKKLIQKHLHKISLVTRFLLISFIYSLVAWCPFVISFVGTSLDIPTNYIFLIYLSLIAVILIWAVAIYIALRTARDEALENLKSTNEKLGWSAARLGAQLWNEKQRMAHVIHKDIQGALISSALKLKSDLANQLDTSESLQRIREIVQGSTDLLLEPTETTSIRDNVKNLNNLWSDVFQLELSIDEVVEEKIQQDPICQQAVNDLIAEFITNAVKHGKATAGTLNFSLFDTNILQMTLTNNGLPLPENPQPGLGSQMVAAQSISVSYTNLVPIGIEFICLLPIK